MLQIIGPFSHDLFEGFVLCLCHVFWLTGSLNVYRVIAFWSIRVINQIKFVLLYRQKLILIFLTTLTECNFVRNILLSILFLQFINIFRLTTRKWSAHVGHIWKSVIIAGIVGAPFFIFIKHFDLFVYQVICRYIEPHRVLALWVSSWFGLLLLQMIFPKLILQLSFARHFIWTNLNII